MCFFTIQFWYLYYIALLILMLSPNLQEFSTISFMRTFLMNAVISFFYWIFQASSSLPIVFAFIFPDIMSFKLSLVFYDFLETGLFFETAFFLPFLPQTGAASAFGSNEVNSLCKFDFGFKVSIIPLRSFSLG